MATPVIMPRQGQSVESCIITQWHKTKGEKIQKGEILFSYETDKAAFDEEAKTSGILLEVFFEEGDEVPVLVNVAVIGAEGEDSSSFRPGNSPKADSTKEGTPQPADIDTVEPETNEPVIQTNTRQKISPLARKLSHQLGVDTQQLKGSGPGGRIIKADIEMAAVVAERLSAPATPEPSGTSPQQPLQQEILNDTGDFRVEKVTNIRRVIAQRMHQSLQNSAQLTHHLSADARGILAFRKKVKKQLQTGETREDITLNDMVCFAVIRALKKHPHMNAHFMGDTLKVFNKVHLGIAVDTPRGLMVSALQNADNLNLSGLASQLKTMAKQCRENTINPDLLASNAGSFTVSNLGAFGIEMFTPVLNLPQTGILGVNTITHRPADLGDGTIGFVPHIGLSLTYDHRAVDGAPASAFLREIKMEIEKLDGGW